MRTMENSPAAPHVWMIAFGIGMSVFFFFSWNPVAKRLKKYEPDPKKGFKTMLLAGLAVYVLAVAGMILAIILHLFGVIS